MDVGTTADLKGGMSPLLAAAKVGTLTVRTDNDTGTITLVTGHGLVTGNKLDVYWDGGSRRNMTATVTGDSCVVDVGLGDNLPLAGVAVTVMKENSENAVFVGDDIRALGISSPDYPATVVFRQADGTEIKAFELDAGQSYVWTDQLVETNPLAGGAVAKITVTHAGSAGPSTVFIDWIID
jgi:hypothetical protein